jgi:hypothetical protein
MAVLSGSASLVQGDPHQALGFSERIALAREFDLLKLRVREMFADFRSLADRLGMH